MITNLLKLLLPKRAPAAKPPEPGGYPDFEAEWTMLADRAGRPDKMACWAMLMRSPYEERPGSNSWLGGLPMAPPRFVWPRDAQGRPLVFAAQVDLSEIVSRPDVALRPTGLPKRGAMLHFIGDDPQCFLLSERQMRHAVELIAPDDMRPTGEMDFHADDPVLQKFSVDLVPLLDPQDGVRITDTPCLPQVPSFRLDPCTWIVNYALAKAEVGYALAEIERAVIGAQKNISDPYYTIPKNRIGPPTLAELDRRDARHAEYRQKLSILEPLKAVLRDWQSQCEEKPDEAAVDEDDLREVFDRRFEIASRMGEGTRRLHGRPATADIRWFWSELIHQHPDIRPRYSDPVNFDAVPALMKPAAVALCTMWRGHRLFGQGAIRDDLGEDLRGKDCALTLWSDDLLGTQGEHNSAVSTWYDRKQMTRGVFKDGLYYQLNDC